MGLKLVTDSSDWPVTIETVKLHLRVETDDDDDIIEAYIDAAVESAEKFQGRALVNQTWDLYLDAWPCSVWEGLRRVNEIRIPKPPLIEVVGVFYLDSAGVEQTLSAALYTVDTANEPGRIILKSGSFPTLPSLANAVRVRFRAGYVDNSMSPAVGIVPKTTNAAIFIMVADLYANRESVVVGDTVSRIPWSAEFLLRLNKFDLSMA